MEICKCRDRAQRPEEDGEGPWWNTVRRLARDNESHREEKPRAGGVLSRVKNTDAESGPWPNSATEDDGRSAGACAEARGPGPSLRGSLRRTEGAKGNGI